MARSISICDERLTGIRHICCFYDSEEQLQDVFVPYLREGLFTAEQVFSIFPRGRHPGLRTRLDGDGIDLAEAEKRGQFQLLTDDETYLTGGHFAKDQMIGRVRALMEDAVKSPFPKVRTVGDMGWALKCLRGADDLVDYEHFVNGLCHQYDCTLACAYDLSQFDGATIADALATHSHVVLNGRVFQNPHYLQPDEFKRFLARRRARA